jgi:hypothetical protein
MYIYRRALPIPTSPGFNAECTSARRGTMAYVRWDLFFHASPKREIKTSPAGLGDTRARRREHAKLEVEEGGGRRACCVCVWYLFSFPCPFVATPHAPSKS